MKYTVMLEVLKWAAENYGRELVEFLLREARKWAQDDGKEDWDDYLVDVLEIVANYFLEKYA